jgi:ribosomal protein S19
MLGIKISVYNGIKFFSFEVDKEKLNCRVGEFAPTRRKPVHKKKKK